MLTNPWIAALVALFAWWFFTGIILLIVRRADLRNAHMWATMANLPVLALGCVVAWHTIWDTSTMGVYTAFFAALAIWGWIELSFLTGVITGPNRYYLREGVPEWERFLRAWGTIAYHEIALLTGLLSLAWLTHGAPNKFAFWTFGVLFFARISAKLNLYLGVRKINTEFIPSPLRHVPSHFREAKINWLFPTSVTALSFAVACFMERIADAPTPAAAAGFALLTTMTALALLEHWLMILRLPDEKLWRWMLPKPQDATQRGPENAL
jgi:putative photosynthetic complex assembly protein 2